MSDGEPDEMVMAIDEDASFIWQDYLEVTNSVEVPCDLFSHVEQSLLNGLEEGMVLEVPLKEPDEFWLASIVMACGPLLRMRYIGESEDRKHEFWCDLTKVIAHPVGWCHSQGKKLTLPTELQDKLPDYESLVEKVLQDAKPAPAELLNGEGLTPVDRIKPGMKLEVEDDKEPHHLWIATIVKSVGGRLFLQYDSFDSSQNFWVFYSSLRLFQLGWAAEKGDPWTLVWPSSKKNNCGVDEMGILIEKARNMSCAAFPSDLIQEKSLPPPHEFKVGMKLEAVHPSNMSELCPATVVRVFDAYYFLVQIDSCEQVEDESPLTWVCTMQHPYIFPVGWTTSHNLELSLSSPRGWAKPFNWHEYLSEVNSVPAPATCFFNNPADAEQLGFESGMKLEAVNPENQDEICVATVNKMSGHLLWISLESNESAHSSHIVSVDSMEIFPVGWCEGNSHPLTPPRFYQIPAKLPSGTDRGDEKEGSNTSSPPPQRSSWCPKIYFNHKCFSGPFLSKSKLALLPKAVGPGPVTLVMHEVLSMLISVAYLSNRVLRVLQADDETERGSHLEVFKAKKNDHVYRANIAVVTSADKVPEFCRSVCKRLQVCPHLFGPTEVGFNNCPEKCHTLSKTRFNTVPVSMGTKSSVTELQKDETIVALRPYKTKRGRKRKRLYKSKQYERTIIKARLSQQQSAGNEPPLTQEDFASLLLFAKVNPEDGTTGEVANSSVNIGTPAVAVNSSITSASGIKRKYKKRVIPHSDIQTRAKVPKHTAQWLKKRGWKRQEQLKKETAPVKRLSKEQSENSSEEAPRIKRKYVRRKPLKEKTIKLPKYANAIRLQSNPLHWTVKDLSQFLGTSKECSHIAPLCCEELIDGHSFMLLNFPTVQENLKLNLDDAMNLCYLVQEVKFAFHIQYIVNNEP